ncbi:ABC-type sugar transport system permease subunit [Devosia subaequoris]|uniref:ABC-type sugar transport system permease subunit n=1 Tax=Devosia subaequoris TaxID=395930 RepID=A0A7W6NB12_9HYPH|nr:sugar ABC transporter permease [Devosia subaequoris]MBB4051206.1 ABC-type sugar transport system permease subunit [Devosia subaequoris]MCP1208130.1 sugar ABC transporter permease [Devosia subaequoris]
MSTSALVHAPRPFGKIALPYALVAPAILVALGIAVLPLLYALWLSFQDWYLLRNPQPVWGGLVNFEALLADSALWRAFWRTWVWTLGTVAVEIGLALPLALLLNRDTAIARMASALILLPWVMPFIVLGYGWRFLLDSEVGALHTLLQFFGIAGNSSILNDPNLALAVITFISGWKGMPFMVLALLAALKSIPDELYEAAAIDGAGPWQRFVSITLPSIQNTMLIIGLVLGILAFYSFDLPWIMARGGPQDATTILGITMFKAVFTDLRPAYAAAISVVMLVILAAASFLTLKLGRRP